MPHSYTFPETASIVGALEPAADAAGRSGAFVTLKNAHLAYVVVYLDQGNAATVQISIEQATAVAGTGAKAITTARIWANQDVAAGDALVRQADAASFTTSAAVKKKLIIFEIDPSTLDLAGGYRCIRVKTGASNVANITSAHYVLSPLRYAGSPPPSAVVD